MYRVSVFSLFENKIIDCELFNNEFKIYNEAKDYFDYIQGYFINCKIELLDMVTDCTIENIEV